MLRRETCPTATSKKQKVSHTDAVEGILKRVKKPTSGKPRFGRYSLTVHFSHRCDKCGRYFQSLSQQLSVALAHHRPQCGGSLPPDIEMIETADMADELADLDDGMIDKGLGHITELDADLFLLAAFRRNPESSDVDSDDDEFQQGDDFDNPHHGRVTIAVDLAAINLHPGLCYSETEVRQAVHIQVNDDEDRPWIEWNRPSFSAVMSIIPVHTNRHILAEQDRLNTVFSADAAERLFKLRNGVDWDHVVRIYKFGMEVNVSQKQGDELLGLIQFLQKKAGNSKPLPMLKSWKRLGTAVDRILQPTNQIRIVEFSLPKQIFGC